MKANNSLRINMLRALELISFFFLGHGRTYPISDLSRSAIIVTVISQPKLPKQPLGLTPNLVSLALA